MELITPDIPQDHAQEIIVRAEAIRTLIITVLIRKGMFQAEAEIAADRMVEADLRGIHSHGSRALKKYIEAMNEGNIDPRAMSITLVETPAIAVIEASGGLGHVSATRGMDLAIKKAREVGTGTVVIRKGQHFGAAAVYVLRAIAEGMIGFCTTSTGTATVAAYGSREPASANPAMAWGIPTGSGAPFVLDMAIAEASWGKIETRGLYGLPIPPHWALNGEGEPTTDASQVVTLQPAAGARGAGLGFICAALTSALIGRKTPIHKPANNAFGPGSDHFFQAIDPRHFGEPEKFLKEIDATIADIHQLTPAEGFDKVRIAGELEWERTQQWQEHGIPLHRSHVETLTNLCTGLKLPLPEGWPA